MHELAQGVTINCEIKANSKKPNLTYEDGRLIIAVRAAAIENKANKEVIESLADFFELKRTQITIISGHKSKSKILLFKEISKIKIEDKLRTLSTNNNQQFFHGDEKVL
ncbi:uncharacterized protein NEHOM01_1432 [Nematocida homosporus]|uniref:uncharacterized protein n=1 Tax=Nematocida homosporus TaxID=1912981 RepID=UPI0022205864|nr:uncharacterized protein NEHOM01_1432 [Nematocida homosporus]KAI5186378.1 uncharacterized protein NEHOM01_1432 [Nematocida homosporus]